MKQIKKVEKKKKKKKKKEQVNFKFFCLTK